jgi:hypothetical protein
MLPTPEQKRRLLHDDRTPPDRLDELADRYVEAERFGEAFEMLEKTRNEERLLRIRRLAVERGEPFLLAQTERLLRDRASTEDWLAVAEVAQRAGRLSHARNAFLRAGDEEKAEAVAADVPTPPTRRPGGPAPSTD